ncbi:MAG: glucose-6-phosphate dehydrogenase [Phycisphaerales bacterium]|jgi:glucose-6-phosphate 1-dehydrogenase
MVEKIKPTLSRMDIVCAETPAEPTALVVFGASGDLTNRKLMPSLFDLYQRQLIGEQFYILGCGRTRISDEQFRQSAKEMIKESSGLTTAFADKMHFISSDYSDVKLYQDLKQRIAELNKLHKLDGNLIFYLSVPPFLYPVIVEQLGKAGLSCPVHGDRQRVRLVIEKPFGHDAESASQLNHAISQCFEESQIYRIDHYLGKETVQNIMMFRFANVIFEPIWNRDYIDHVQITIAESVGVEHRAGYYEKTGALRDMFPNHMLQMLALVAMEPPASFAADMVRDEKAKLLRSIRPIGLEPWSTQIVRGQYGPGQIADRQVCGYLQEEGISPDSKTETYVAAKLGIDNWRWKDVPFYVRTGKRLSAKNTEITITFKKVPHSMFVGAGLDELPPNILTLQIQPHEGISLQFQAKRPGSKLCMGTLDMSFRYSDVFGADMPEAYARLLLDAMLGDQTLFNRYDSVETGWKLFDPVLKAWQENDSGLFKYPAGAQSFSAADNLIESDGRKWRPIADR